MNIRTMRTIDRYVGVPLCWMTGVWNTAVRKRMTVRRDAVDTILVIKFFGFGSILLTTPFLTKLYEQFPSALIFYLSFESNREILEKLPFRLHVLTISSKSFPDFLRDTLVALRQLRRAKLTIVFDLEFFSKFSTVLSVFSGGRFRVGYELPTQWRRSNLTHPIPLDRSAHVTRVFLKQLEAIGISSNEHVVLTHLQATETERIAMERKLGLATNGIEVIAVNINAGPTSWERRWQPEYFIEVGRHLVRQNSARKLFFIGSADEHAYIDETLTKFPELKPYATNCAGILSVGELIALLRRSSFLLTNDSGPMHLASATGTKVVALFGPESPQFYGPLGDVRVVYKGIECSPCLNMYNAKLFVCPYNARCMKEISVDEVLNAIRSLEGLSADKQDIPLVAHV
ncbi:MAG: glycosyltransferase family 9 protein [Bacteroidota bacterium]